MFTVDYRNSDRNVLIVGELLLPNAEEILPSPAVHTGFTIQVTPTGGSCSVSVSNDGVGWIEWDMGSVSVSTIGAVMPTRYLKIANTSSTDTVYTIWGF
jgi:hypothetical protein